MNLLPKAISLFSPKSGVGTQSSGQHTEASLEILSTLSNFRPVPLVRQENTKYNLIGVEGVSFPYLVLLLTLLIPVLIKV